MIYLTSPNFTAARGLAEALAGRGVDAAVVEWGKSPQAAPKPGDRWIVLSPKELPPFAPLPKCEYKQVDVDAALEMQVGLVLKDNGLEQTL